MNRLHLDPLLWLLEKVFQHDLDQMFVQVAINARNQGSARCSAKGADAETGVETIESDNEVDGNDEAGVGDDEVVEL